MAKIKLEFESTEMAILTFDLTDSDSATAFKRANKATDMCDFIHEMQNHIRALRKQDDEISEDLEKFITDFHQGLHDRAINLDELYF